MSYQQEFILLIEPRHPNLVATNPSSLERQRVGAHQSFHFEHSSDDRLYRRHIAQHYCQVQQKIVQKASCMTGQIGSMKIIFSGDSFRTANVRFS